MTDHSVSETNPFLFVLMESRLRTLRHCVLILVVGFVLLHPDNGVQIEVGDARVNERLSFLFSIVFFIAFLIIIYLNLYWFLPRYLIRRKYGQYLISISVVVLVFFMIIYLIDVFYFSTFRQRGQKASLTMADLLAFSFIVWLIVGAVTAVKLFQLWVLDTFRINQLEKLQLQSELTFLKSQINPHFLFNMLNSLYVLQQKDVSKASELVLKLSELLRYQLYDSARENVMLSADINFIRRLLTLEKIRRDNFDFEIQVEGDTQGVVIPPLLFIPFVENAVKHNVDGSGMATVFMKFTIGFNAVIFQCTNAKRKKSHESTHAGIGLSNIRRRLDILYGEKYVLTIEEKIEQFTVKLTIPI